MRMLIPCLHPKISVVTDHKLILKNSSLNQTDGMLQSWT